MGSHRCTPYRGILIKNAVMHANQSILLDHVWSSVGLVRERIKKFSVPVVFWIEIRAIRSGIEPIRV